MRHLNSPRFVHIPSHLESVPILALAFAILTSLSSIAPAVTVTDFGFDSMKANNVLALGSRPLLVIVANYAGSPTLASYDWEALIFGTGSGSLSEYYSEVSNNRFHWTRAGLLQVTFTEPERNTKNTREQIVTEAQSQTGFDFAIYDANHNGVVTSNELCILIIHNLSDGGGQTGGATLTVPSRSTSTIALNLGVSGVAHRDSLMTFCHEVSHTFGTLDLYSGGNGLHSAISLMGPTSTSDSNRRKYHLDPWHKMVLGWLEPRIVSLRGNGAAILPAAQLGRIDAPVLLFDPVRGMSEFYLLEYRTNNSPSGGGGFDANVASSGLFIWHIWQNPDHTPVLSSPHTTLPSPSQLGWAYCKKCSGMFFKPGIQSSHCPAGAGHEPLDSHTYSMVKDAPNDPGQQNWRWCKKCQGMFFGGNSLATRCPADGGSHDGSLSGNYALRFQSQPMNGGQNGWRWCSKCQGLFSSGGATLAGVCPVSGQHDGQASSDYRMHYDSWDVFSEAAPSNVLGLSTAWGVSQTTPNSRWYSDATEVAVRYRPVAFLNGGDELLVEWTSDLAPPAFGGETWVDYSASSFGNGGFQLPFNSLRQAVDASAFYTRIKIKPGMGNERITIRQSVMLEAPLGRVTIGQ